MHVWELSISKAKTFLPFLTGADCEQLLMSAPASAFNLLLHLLPRSKFSKSDFSWEDRVSS